MENEIRLKTIAQIALAAKEIEVLSEKIIESDKACTQTSVLGRIVLRAAQNILELSDELEEKYGMLKKMGG